MRDYFRILNKFGNVPHVSIINKAITFHAKNVIKTNNNRKIHF